MPAHLYALIAKKEEEIRRLQACQSSLQVKQGEFNDNEEKCLEPELTETTWHGSHASDFQEIREDGIHAPYLEIASEQFEKVYEMIVEKIAALRLEIEALHRAIASILAARAAK